MTRLTGGVGTCPRSCATRRGTRVLIDIEGAMVFDVEWEDAFVELRFGPNYPVLMSSDLDPARLDLCRLTHYLSLVAGPLVLLDGDSPRRAGMLDFLAAART